MKLIAVTKYHFTAITICLAILALTATNSYPQDIQKLGIDQLWDFPHKKLDNLIAKNYPDTVKFKLLLALSISIESKPGSFKTDVDSVVNYLSKAEKIGNKLNKPLYKTEVAERFGQLYLGNSDTLNGRKYYNQAIQLCRQTGDKDYEAYLWSAMADRTEGALQLTYYQSALNLYHQVKNKNEEIETLKKIADYHYRENKLDLAENELKQVLKMYAATGYKKLHFTYDLLAVISRQRGDINKTLLYSINAVQSAETTKDSSGIGTFYWRLGDAYLEVGNQQKVMLYYEKALRYLIRYPGPVLYHVLEVYTNALIKNGEVKKALSNIAIVKKAQPPIDAQDKIALSIATAECYVALKDYTKAEFYYSQYADLLTNEDYSGTLIKICNFFISQKKYARASFYLERILKSGYESWTLPHVRDVHLIRFKVDSASGNFQSAINHLQLYNKLNASIFTAEKTKQAEELQVKFDIAGKEKDNQLLRDKSNLQAKELQHDRLTKKIIIGSCLVLLLLIGLLYNRYRLKQKNNEELQLQKEEIRLAYRELEKIISEKNKLIGEKEFLLKEIHHRVKNNLQLTMSLLNSQSSYLDNEAAIKAIKESQHRLKSISLVHQKLYQTDNVGKIYVKAYIHEMVAYLRESFNTGERIRFELAINELDLDVGRAVSLGLFINEAITNIFKYAFPLQQTGIVKISLIQKEPGHFMVQIKDNGVGLQDGFDIHSGNSLGITLMKGLSLQLDGEFTMENDNGVSICMAFVSDAVYSPLEPAE
jgi:two-component sensor histidine kinase